MKKIMFLGVVVCTACSPTPTSGVYSATSTLGENTCGESLALEAVTDEDLKIDVDTANNKVFIEDDFECDLAGNVVSCLEVFEEDQGEGYNFTAYLVWELTWSTSTKASGEYGFEGECDGESCAGLGELAGIEFPCESKANVEIELR